MEKCRPNILLVYLSHKFQYSEPRWSPPSAMPRNGPCLIQKRQKQDPHFINCKAAVVRASAATDRDAVPCTLRRRARLDATSLPDTSQTGWSSLARRTIRPQRPGGQTERKTEV